MVERILTPVLFAVVDCPCAALPCDHFSFLVKYGTVGWISLAVGRQRAVTLTMHCHNAVLKLLIHSINAGNEHLGQFDFISDCIVSLSAQAEWRR